VDLHQKNSQAAFRGGKSVASISPVTQPVGARNLGELKSLLAAIPKLGAEAEAFESDITAARENQPDLPKGS